MSMLDEILASTLRHALESKHGIAIVSKRPSELKRRLWLRRKELVELEPDLDKVMVSMGPIDNSEVWIVKTDLNKMERRLDMNGRRSRGQR